MWVAELMETTSFPVEVLDRLCAIQCSTNRCVSPSMDDCRFASSNRIMLLIYLFTLHIWFLFSCLVLACSRSLLTSSFATRQTSQISYDVRPLTVNNYTPGIYAEGYIVFAFPFVRSYVRLFVRSFVLPSVTWNLRQSFALKFLKWCISQQLLIRKLSYLDHSYP